MAKEPTLEIVSKKDEMAGKNKNRQKMVELLTAKIENAEKELTTKKYVIEGGLESADNIINFLTNDASWKFSEALGIVEALKQFETAKKAINTNKTKDVFVESLAIEALYYFLTKVENKGVATASSYIKVLKPVSDALGRAKTDRQSIDQMVRDRGTLESAIDGNVDLENEDSILKEIQNELAREI